MPTRIGFKKVLDSIWRVGRIMDYRFGNRIAFRNLLIGISNRFLRSFYV